MSAALYTVTNPETGMTAMVHESHNPRMPGFNIVLRDDDSGEYLNEIWSRPALEGAITKAREVTPS